MDRVLGEMRQLVEVVDRLRGPGGCPWDQQQTLADMARHMTEEVAEVADAVEEDGGTASPAVAEELGDVLMNVLLAARIGSETGGFDLGTVAAGIREKLVRRHPHVFGDTEVDSVDDVLTNWEAIKASEKTATPSGRLSRVPRSLAPLARAHELSKAAARVGFDWPNAQGTLDKVREELEEVSSLIDAESGSIPAGETSAAVTAELQSELGDLLFAVANLCRKLGVRPDDALRTTLKKFERRFRAIEERFPDPSRQTLDELEAVWEEAKLAERSSAPAPPGETSE